MKTLLVYNPSLTFDLPGDETAVGGKDVTIISYARMAEQFSHLRKLHFLSTIIDEAHHLKNEKDLGKKEREQILKAVDDGHAMSLHRTQIAFELCRQIKHVFCLTGTPILSRPRELFNLLRLTRHPLGISFKKFSEEYCAGIQTDFGWNANGASNLLDLSHALHNHLLRRLKSEVLTLPPKIVTIESFTLPPEARDEYNSAWRDYVAEVKTKKSKGATRRIIASKTLVQPTLLRRICSLAKVEHVVRRVARSKEKIIIFTSHSETLRALARAFKKEGISFVSYDGKTTEPQKVAAVTKFQTDPAVRVFLANTMAAKTGITLTAAAVVVYMDFCWTPADHSQSEDRAHHIGQTRIVRVFYLVAKGTVEEDILDLLDHKRKVIEQLYDTNASMAEVDQSVEKELMRKLAA